jgi:hypothetical protein
MKDSALIAVVVLTVILAVIISKAGLLTIKNSGTTGNSSAFVSTGDPMKDAIYQDYPELDPRR